jgi:translation initiation factor 1
MDLRDQLKNMFPDHEEQDFEMPAETDREEKFVQKEPLVCKFEKKGRHGKPVTLIEGFEGSEEDLKKISKKIKTTLGIGG